MREKTLIDMTNGYGDMLKVSMRKLDITEIRMDKIYIKFDPVRIRFD